MQQATAQPGETGLERYGATDIVTQSYTRSHPSGTQEPIWDIFGVSLGRLEETDATNNLLQAIVDDAFARLNEHWSTVDLRELPLPAALDNVSRQFYSGSINGSRLDPSESYFYARAFLLVDDVIGTISGFSSWYPSALEVAYLGDIFTSLALATPPAGEAGLAAVLPTAELLVGGLEIAD